jgi:hypothetical protein
MSVRRRTAAVVAAVAAITAVAAAAAVAVTAGTASAHPALAWTPVAATPVVRGVAAPDALSPQLRQQAVAQGAHRLENPSGVVGFDFGYLVDLGTDYARDAQPVRFLAAGRDEAATLDSMLLAAGNGFPNDGDNEITGIHCSDGDPGVGGILGAKILTPLRGGWRLFWTQQHDRNTTWEIHPT